MRKIDLPLGPLHTPVLLYKVWFMGYTLHVFLMCGIWSNVVFLVFQFTPSYDHKKKENVNKVEPRHEKTRFLTMRKQ